MTGVPDSTDADQLYILGAIRGHGTVPRARVGHRRGRLLASGVLALIAGACWVARLRECMFRVNDCCNLRKCSRRWLCDYA
jgi:hypothetical protein